MNPESDLLSAGTTINEALGALSDIAEVIAIAWQKQQPDLAVTAIDGLTKSIAKLQIARAFVEEAIKAEHSST